MRETLISVAAVISAAGSSSRMGGVKKEYLPLGPTENSLTVLGAALSAFLCCPRIGPIVITVPPDSENGEAAARACLPAEFLHGEGQNRILFVPGGPSRRSSVHNALSLLEKYHPSHVLIHDGARPWIKPALIERIIDAAIRYGAVIPALPLLETPKEFSGFPETANIQSADTRPEEAAFITRHLKRSRICSAQTPQGFSFPEILIAHEKAVEREDRENIDYTDDAEVWGEFIGQVAVIPGDPANRKITYPEDLVNAEFGIRNSE